MVLTGSTFDITYTISSPTQIEPLFKNIGNFSITMDNLFPTFQTSHLSPTLQLNYIKSQQNNLFDDNDDGMDDEELLEAFNKHMESSSSNQITNPSTVLILINRVNTQTDDITLPKFDLEFSFNDLDNSDHTNNNVLET